MRCARYSPVFCCKHTQFFFSPVTTSVLLQLVLFNLCESCLLILGAIATVLYLGDMEHWHEFGIALSIVIFLYAVAESQDGQPAVLSALTLLGLPLLAAYYSGLCLLADWRRTFCRCSP